MGNDDSCSFNLVSGSTSGLVSVLSKERQPQMVIKGPVWEHLRHPDCQSVNTFQESWDKNPYLNFFLSRC